MVFSAPVKVSLQHLVKRFADFVAVDEVSLEIADGELFFLLGPSGCGKTTLLRSVAGFYTPDSGTIHIGDTDVTHLPAHQRDTAMVFQSYALWPHLTVRDNVAFGLDVRRVAKDEMTRRVDEALAMVQMTDRANHKPAQLSGGQQQRVALARALVVRPKCLLLDEPLSNLDAKLRLEMRAEIRRICKEAKLTGIYVTHDQKEALSIADRLAVMEQGKLAQVGEPREVYERPVSRFVASFIGETNFVEGRVKHTGEVATAFGVVRCATSSSGPVTLSLRPEVIHLGAPPSDAPNVFTGVVHDTIYLGEMAQHLVNVDGTTFKVLDLHPKIVARDNQQAETKVWFRPENVVVLTR